MTATGPDVAQRAEAGSLPQPEIAVSEDRILGGRLRLRQPVKGYRVAIDPLLLGAAVPARPGEKALDLGCGVGAAALCLALRIPGLEVGGIDVQPALVRLATENAALNGVAERVKPSVGDVLALPSSARDSDYDHVFCNPPYLAHGAATAATDASRAVADLEGEARLSDWVAAALAAARLGGTVTFIHRADRLDELLAAMQGRAGGTVIYPLWPKAVGARAEGGSRPAKRVIVQARKGKSGPARLLPGLVLHDDDGAYTPAAEDVLRGGEALRF